MLLLLEKIVPFKDIYEYDVFENDIEINYSNILFSIRVYALTSNHKNVENRLDVIVFSNTERFRSLQIPGSELVRELNKCIKMELCEIGIDNNTQIEIMIVEDSNS
ncbi:MAG: hypothetical protein WBH44_04340 [Proteocatella sp.]